MRAVVDTNVFVSGLINPLGPPGHVVDETYVRSFVLLYDDRIFGEYTEVFHRPELPIDADQADALLGFIESEGEYVSGRPTDVVLPDMTELPFLEVAIAGRADALITGNLKHFNPVHGSHHVRVISPVDFLRKLNQ